MNTNDSNKKDTLINHWQPSKDTLDILKLNGMPDEHIRQSVSYLKDKFLNTSIDDIEGYNSWSELFIVFCIKAFDEKEKNTRSKQ